MKLIQHFEALIKGGVVLNFKIAAAGENVQLDIIPVGKDNKTGISLPPRALVGTASEIDEALDEYLPKYAGSVSRIADVVANADTEIAAAEAAAASQAKRAVEDKSKNKVKAVAGKPSTDTKRGPEKGMLTVDDDDEGSDDDNDNDKGTTLDTTGGLGKPPPGNAGEGGALSPELF